MHTSALPSLTLATLILKLVFSCFVLVAPMAHHLLRLNQPMCTPKPTRLPGHHNGVVQLRRLPHLAPLHLLKVQEKTGLAASPTSTHHLSRPTPMSLVESLEEDLPWGASLVLLRINKCVSPTTTLLDLGLHAGVLPLP